jgi:WhiB family transcriptional regulator, redox-sensing transcriptional regulator
VVAPNLKNLYTRFGERPAWMDRAACIGVPVKVFYPTDEHGETAAKEVCATCEVRADCLAYALNQHRDATDAGIWGGTTERERRAIRRRTRRAIIARRKDVTSVT